MKTISEIAHICMQSHYPAELEIVGEPRFDQVIVEVLGGATVPVEVSQHQGRRNEIAEAVRLAYEVVVIAKYSIELYKILAKKFGRSPTKEEVAVEVAKEVPSADQELRDQVVHTAIDSGL